MIINTQSYKRTPRDLLDRVIATCQ